MTLLISSHGYYSRPVHSMYFTPPAFACALLMMMWWLGYFSWATLAIRLVTRRRVVVEAARLLWTPPKGNFQNLYRTSAAPLALPALHREDGARQEHIQRQVVQDRVQLLCVFLPNCLSCLLESSGRLHELEPVAVPG